LYNRGNTALVIKSICGAPVLRKGIYKGIKAAFEVDFLEMKRIAAIKIEGQSITFDLGKFEIKTISLNYD
jgi:hypothetical protein